MGIWFLACQRVVLPVLDLCPMARKRSKIAQMQEIAGTVSAGSSLEHR